MKQQSKMFICFAVLFVLVLVGVVAWMNHSFEVAERNRYATSFKERLTIFNFLQKEDYGEANKLLSILLTGDVLVFEKVGKEIDANEYGLCSRLSPEVKEKLIAFYYEQEHNSDNDLTFNTLESSCAE